MKNILLRPIQAKDNAAVARIIRQVMTEFACVGPGYSIEDPEVDAMYEAYAGEGSAFYVLTIDDTVLGCGGFGPLQGGDTGVCELKKMYFLPAARGLGQGKKLLQLCIEQAKACRYRRMYLETVNRMVTAQALYRKAGFRQLSCPQGATGHASCDAYFSLEL